MKDAGEFDGILPQAQIIIGALAAGVVSFLIIVIVFLGAHVEPFDPGAIVSMVMAAFALTVILVRLFIPGTIVSSGCRKIAQGTWTSTQPNIATPDTNEGKLLQLFLTKTIIGAALLEGGAFGNLVAFMIEGQIYSIILAVLFLLGILIGFPTRRGLAEWLETQLRRVQEIHDLKM